MLQKGQAGAGLASTAPARMTTSTSKLRRSEVPTMGRNSLDFSEDAQQGRAVTPCFPNECIMTRLGGEEQGRKWVASRSQALPGNALCPRLRLGRQSLQGSGFPGRAWEPGKPAPLRGGGALEFGEQIRDDLPGAFRLPGQVLFQSLK